MKILLFLALLILSSVGQANNHPINIIPPSQEKTITVSNRTPYPIVSTEVSGLHGFLAVSGWDQVLFLGEEQSLVFTIDTAEWGCHYVVSLLSSDEDENRVSIDLCEEGNSYITLSPSEEEQ